jgi:SWI/SNF-related matrix-associated actin-dependent regulator 1 of chromatin subfamily A|tara:strand:+ start:1685 stop:2626 length:942 start_codon:yes stop_codon:yes gene_type:complete
VKLRKIANHPLLVRDKFSDKDVEEIAGICHKAGVFGYEATIDRVRGHLFDEGYSDFDLHKLCGDPNLRGQLSHKRLADDAVLESGKTKKLLSLLEELKKKGSRPLIFSQWKIVLDILEVALQSAGHKVRVGPFPNPKHCLHPLDECSTSNIYQYWQLYIHHKCTVCPYSTPILKTDPFLFYNQYVRLDGGTPTETRQTICDDYNDPNSDLFAFLLSTRAGGQGLNLTSADTVVIHDCDFNPQIDRQAEDRCHRLGQTKPVTVIRLVTGDSVDQRIVDIATRKLDLDAQILSDPKALAAAENRAMHEIMEDLLG